MTKIIDQKGRLFGLINVIDLSIIMLMLFFAVLIFVGYFAINRPANVAESKWITVEIKLTEVEPELVEVINKGDLEQDSYMRTIGKLAAISSVKASKVWVIVDNQRLSTIDHPTKKDIIVDAEIFCTKKEGIWYYKSEPVKINNKITFATKLYNLPGLVIKMVTGGKSES